MIRKSRWLDVSSNLRLRTYTAEEVAELMHCHVNRVREWAVCGLITPIKTGKSCVYSSEEIHRFQTEQIGRDISSLKAIKDKKTFLG